MESNRKYKVKQWLKSDPKIFQSKKKNNILLNFFLLLISPQITSPMHSFLPANKIAGNNEILHI